MSGDILGHKKTKDEIKPTSLREEDKTDEVVSDDCDIIPKTPPCEIKKLKKRIKHKHSVKPQASWDEDSINVDFDEKCVIESTKTGTFDFNKPYVFHSLSELINYSTNCLPKNDNIHLIGVFDFDKMKKYILRGINDNQMVTLDMSLTKILPKEKDVISVFGSLEYDKNTSMFVVRFFRKEVSIPITKYIENLKILRNFIPREYFKTIECNKSANFLL